MPVMTKQNARTFAGMPIDDGVEQKTGIFLGLFGSGGCGKTTTLSRIVESPRINRAILIDAEGGSSSVRHLVPQGLDIVHANSWDDVVKYRRELAKEGHGYDVAIWDHLSELTNLYKMKVAPSGMPTIPEWGKILAQMMEFVREQRRLTITSGLHVFFNLWEEREEEKDDNTTIIHNRVALFKSFKTAFPGMVTMLGRMTSISQTPSTKKLSFIAGERTDSKFRVAPTEAGASIPQELYLRLDQNNFIVDFLDAVCYGEKFDASKYAKKEAR